MAYKIRFVVAALAVGFLYIPAAHAADPTVKCEATKLKAASKRDSCLAKEAIKDRLGKASNSAKCEAKFSEALANADEKAAAKGISCRYVDNGDGTVSDLDTGLLWQQLDDAGGLTDKDNLYTWTDTADGDLSNPDGTLFTEFLAGLNACQSTDGATVTGGFAGRCTWRIPQIDELLAILDCSSGTCVYPAALGPRSSSNEYWSSTQDETWLKAYVPTKFGGTLTFELSGGGALTAP